MAMDAPQAQVLHAVAGERQAMQELLRELVRAPSVGGTRAESELQQRLAGDFAAFGLETDVWSLPLVELAAEPDFPGAEVARQEAIGVVGRLRGSRRGRTLMLNGHVDVVPPGDLGAWTNGDPFAATIADGRLYGRGACDMKGGLVAAIWAVRALQQSGVDLAGDVLLASVEGEEDGGLGTYALLRRGWRADACVIPEPTGLDLVPANAGALTFRLRVRGHATHASRRTEGESALEHFWPVWKALRKYEAERNADVDPIMRRWPMPYALSIGTLRCGDWASSVPDLLVAEGRLGVALDESPAQARAAFESAVENSSAANAWLRAHPVEVEWWGGQFASGRLPQGNDLLERMRAAHAVATGPDTLQPAVWGAPYGSDLRLLAGLGGIPTLHYGPGDAGLAHGPNESVPLAEVELAARALAVLALEFTSAH
ncbi:MAG: ArgE/DapE family deacylase [Chloroflexota bacterium]|nr:ArgE/DapE family deacylase [Chloroflexota bacterium]